MAGLKQGQFDNNKKLLCAMSHMNWAKAQNLQCLSRGLIAELNKHSSRIAVSHPEQMSGRITMRTHTPELNRRLTFGRDNRFQSELRRRVDEYFRRTGRRQRDCPQMYLKTAIILSIFAGLYSYWSLWPRHECRGQSGGSW